MMEIRHYGTDIGMNDPISRQIIKLDTSFSGLLKRAGHSKASFAREIGKSRSTIASWKSSPPRYAIAYLELLIECNRWKP